MLSLRLKTPNDSEVLTSMGSSFHHLVKTEKSQDACLPFALRDDDQSSSARRVRMAGTGILAWVCLGQPEPSHVWVSPQAYCYAYTYTCL